MIIPLIRPFTASSFVVKFADRPWEFRDAAALRRQVFCDEQQLFRDHDRDEVDAVVASADAREAKEAGQRAAIERGESTAELLGLMPVLQRLALT